jgi:hypothetical protein
MVTPIIKERRYSYTGLFNVKQTYDFCKDFLIFAKHYDVNERDYAETNSDKAEEITAIVEATQDYTDYFVKEIKYVINLSGNKVEVEVNGKKKTMVKGKASLVLNASIEEDASESRNLKGFRKFLNDVYNKYINKSDLEKCVISTKEDANELIEKFKQAVNSETAGK